MNKAIRYIILGVLILGVISIILGRFWSTSLPEAVKSEYSVPNTIFKNYAGEEIRLSDFKGKVVLVNAWASWCPFCSDELLDFAVIKKEFGDKLEIIAIDRAELQEIVKKYSDALGVGDKIIFLLDPEDKFYKSIGGFSMPETIFVDKDGFIRDHKRGPMELEEIRRRVEKIL